MAELRGEAAQLNFGESRRIDEHFSKPYLTVERE